MSGFNPFGLSSLGSLSTLGNLAQSARLNDLVSKSRSQGSDWDRDQQRRSFDDDFFGGGGRMGGRNRRSLSPPRSFDHDDRRGTPRRDRGNARRSRDSFGSSSGAGILGAAPSLNDMPGGGGSLSGLGDLGGFGGSSWNEHGSPNTVNQINSQTQQLLNMMQTQQLLAAVQANLNTPGPPSLMQKQAGPGYGRYGGRNMGPMNQRGNQGRYRNDRNDRNDRSRFGMQRNRDDRKRRSSPIRNPMPKRDRRDTSQGTRSDRKDQDAKKSTSQADKNKKDVSKDSKTTKDVAEKEKKAEVKEEEKTKRNAAGEDVDALVSKNFDGKRYWCGLCKIVCLKTPNIYKHYLSQRHVKAAIEKQGKVFDPEIMKATTEKEKPKSDDITNLVKYVCNTRKIARKEKDDVYISSLTDCTVKISDFAKKQNFMGSEFVKAISGFKCQLCKAFLRSGYDVVQHIQGKRHSNNYEAYLKSHPSYPETQMQVNKNLVEILEKQEGKDVLLFEVKNDELVDGAQKAEEAEKNCKLEEQVDKDDGVSYNMDDYDPSEDSKQEQDNSVADQSTVLDDSAVEESNVAEHGQDEEKVEELDAEVEKSLLNEDEDAEVDDIHDQENEDQLLETPSEEQVSFVKPDSDVPTEEEKAEKPEESTKEEIEDEEIRSPSPSETSVKEEPEEEVESPAPGRRSARRGRGRGRGATKATRGKGTRRNTRGAKNAGKKAVEAEIPDEVDAEAKEEAAEEIVEVAEENAKEVCGDASKEATEEAAKETTDDNPIIDGFEVIDEIDGGDDDAED